MGTATIASREIAEIVGRIMIARTTAVGSNPGPLSLVLKIGIQPNPPWTQLATGRKSGINTKSPQRPKTTLGIAASN